MNTFSPALAIIAAAKLRAEEEKKGAPEMTTLPPVGGDAAPLAPMAPMQAFPTGTLVRDILSGTTGVVVDPPQGDFGELVFVKCDTDQMTYPMRSDQLEVVPSAQPPMAPPAPAATAPAPEEEPGIEEEPAEEEGEEKGKTKASLKAGVTQLPSGRWKDTNGNSYATKREADAAERANQGEPLEDEAPAAEYPKKLPSGRWQDQNGNSYATRGEAARAQRANFGAALRANDRVSHPKAEKVITYGDVLKASKPTITASKLMALFGYVPKHWDRIIASLQKDGVTVLRANAKLDVKDMIAKGLNAQEIIIEACAKNGAVLKATLKDIQAAGLEAAKIADNKAKLAAAKPNKPMPTEELGPGMAWVWDDTKKDWFATTLNASKDEKVYF